MKTTFEIETEDAACCRHVRAKSGVRQRFTALLFALILGGGVAGCSFLKPAKPTARFFVLTPMPGAAGAESAASKGLAVGLGGDTSVGSSASGVAGPQAAIAASAGVTQETRRGRVGRAHSE